MQVRPAFGQLPEKHQRKLTAYNKLQDELSMQTREAFDEDIANVLKQVDGKGMTISEAGDVYMNLARLENSIDERVSELPPFIDDSMRRRTAGPMTMSVVKAAKGLGTYVEDQQILKLLNRLDAEEEPVSQRLVDPLFHRMHFSLNKDQKSTLFNTIGY